MDELKLKNFKSNLLIAFQKVARSDDVLLISRGKEAMPWATVRCFKKGEVIPEQTQTVRHIPWVNVKNDPEGAPFRRAIKNGQLVVVLDFPSRKGHKILYGDGQPVLLITPIAKP